MSKIHNKIRFDYEFRPYRCQNCGLVFLHPYFPPSQLDEFYEKEFRNIFGNETSEDLFKRCSPEAFGRAERFKRLLGKSKNIVEIGCSTGHFLCAAKKFGPNVFGVELGESTKQYAAKRGIIVKKNIKEYDSDKFDLIFMFHVLEHISDPINFLKEIKPYLKTSGKLIIEVPNIEDILVSLYKIEEFMDLYFSAPHKFYFSKETLQRVMLKAGFKNDVYPFQRYDMSNHIYWLLHRKPGGMRHFQELFSEKLNQEYANCLKDKFLCDTIYAIGERDD